MLKQVRRWFPDISLTVLGDGAFATALFCWECITLKIDLVSRLRIDARLYDFPEERSKGARGRPPKKGAKLMSFKEMSKMEGLPWKDVEINGYGGKRCKVRFITNVSLWHVAGFEPVPIRWVLVIDPAGKKDPLPIFSTNFNLSGEQIIELFVERWGIEVTFEEVRAHLGVETQRQWSDGAIARTTPVLMGLFSLLCLMGNDLLAGKELEKGDAAWYQKKHGTFSDVLALIRKELWHWRYFNWFDENDMNRENQSDGRIDWLLDMLGSATG
jgi:hypothetical protein